MLQAKIGEKYGDNFELLWFWGNNTKSFIIQLTLKASVKTEKNKEKYI